MGTADRVWLLLPRPLRTLPADLAAVAVFTCLTTLVSLLPVLAETPLRVVFGLAFVLFVPGYAVVAALFPGDRAAGTDGVDPRGVDGRSGSIDGIERIALSLGLSIAIVPLVGLALHFTPWGIRLVPILGALVTLVLAATAVAVRRRLALRPEQRFRVPYRQWVASARDALFAQESRTDAALNVVFLLSVVLAVSTVAYAVVVPQQGERFTELSLLTETDDGTLVADGYPTNFTNGSAGRLVAGITNQELRREDYTLLVQLQQVRTTNDSTAVTSVERLRRFDVTLAHNETWHQSHTIRPTMTGQRLRLAYLLYRGSPPASPSMENAYRETHLWINVSAAG